jgi:hypothetical protein
MVTASRDVLQMFYSEAKVRAGSMVNPGGAVPKTKTHERKTIERFGGQQQLQFMIPSEQTSEAAC